MASLFSTWAGLIKYTHPLMPLIRATAVFEPAGEGKFVGMINEEPFILPKEFENTCDLSDRPLGINGKQYGLMSWGSASCAVLSGNLPDIIYRDWGVAISFVKMPDQLTGYPVLFRGAFNSAADKIVGHWNIVEGDTPCLLPISMKEGHFTFRNPKGRPITPLPDSAPVAPELLIA